MIARHKVPGNICLFPIINAFMKKIYRCKSDNRGNVKEYIIPGFNEGYLSTYVIEPKNCCTTLPGIVFYHGGGFLLRASGSHYQIAKWYAERANCKVVYADYRLAPKYPFPTPPEDCYYTYQWVIENAQMLGIDKNRIAVGISGY